MDDVLPDLQAVWRVPRADVGFRDCGGIVRAPPGSCPVPDDDELAFLWDFGGRADDVVKHGKTCRVRLGVSVRAGSLCEIACETRCGRVDLPLQERGPAFRCNAVEELVVTHGHAEFAPHLEWAHRDLWDRLLATRALLERCILVPVDRAFDATSIVRRW